MALKDYPYSISQDFPNGKVDTGRLTVEIQSSSIVTALNRVDTNGDTCSIWFNDDLNTTDKITLDALVAAHTGKSIQCGPLLVQLDETNGLDSNIALSCTEDVSIDVLAGQSISEGFFEMPFLVDIVAAQYYMYETDWVKGDSFNVEGLAVGDPAVGVVAETASSGQSEVIVSDTVFAYTRAGLALEFDGDASLKTYRIASMDSALNKVTLMRNLENELIAGTVVRVRRVFMPHVRVLKETLDTIGGLNAGSSVLAIGDKLRIRYHHEVEPTTTYKLYVRFIYLY